MYKDGRMYVCERCYAWTFCERTETESLDGGFTKVDHYEKLPEDWDSHVETGLLCGRCNTEYKELFAKFMTHCGEKEKKK